MVGNGVAKKARYSNSFTRLCRKVDLLSIDMSNYSLWATLCFISVALWASVMSLLELFISVLGIFVLNRLSPVLLRLLLSYSLLGMFYHSAAQADQTIDLYSAKVLVINQTSAVRNKAAVNELSAVFVRMSGSDAVLQNPKVREAIKNASRFVDEFSYQSTDQQITLAGTQYNASLLQLNFTPSPLEAILREQQLPFWPTNRPEVLVWMAQASDGQQYVAGNSSLSRALERAAKAKGLPSVKPLLDLQDRQELPVAKILASDERSIVRAAERYKVDAVISGRIRKQGSGYQADFILNHQGQTQYLRATGNSQRALANDIMAQSAGFFADIYAVVSGEQRQTSDRLQLVVNNAGDFTVYAEVLRYLQKLKLLERSQLALVSDVELVFEVDYNGNIAQLQQRLALDKKLLFVEDKTVFETVVTPVNNDPASNESANNEPAISEPANNELEADSELATNTDIVPKQTIALPPIQEETAIRQLVFAWQ